MSKKIILVLLLILALGVFYNANHGDVDQLLKFSDEDKIYITETFFSDLHRAVVSFEEGQELIDALSSLKYINVTRYKHRISNDYKYDLYSDKEKVEPILSITEEGLVQNNILYKLEEKDLSRIVDILSGIIDINAQEISITKRDYHTLKNTKLSDFNLADHLINLNFDLDLLVFESLSISLRENNHISYLSSKFYYEDKAYVLNYDAKVNQYNLSKIDRLNHNLLAQTDNILIFESLMSLIKSLEKESNFSVLLIEMYAPYKSKMEVDEKLVYLNNEKIESRVYGLIFTVAELYGADNKAIEYHCYD